MGNEQLLLTHCSEYQKVLPIRRDSPESALALFGGSVQRASFLNLQTLGFEGVVGRLLSASYPPKPGHPEHERLIAGLRELFLRSRQDGQVVYDYETRVYYGRLPWPSRGDQLR
jgi:hypothetical protein